MRSSRTSPPTAILMVDDRVENLVALEAVLQPLGHTLVRALSGEEALRHILMHDFAVILLDVQMPGMNGFEVAEVVKSRDRSRHTPIIFLTAISKEEAYVFKGYSAGAVDYLFKPFDPDILRSKVAVFVDLHMKGQQLREQAELLRQSERREMELMHQARLVESDARYGQIVGSAIDAIVTFDDDRKVTVFNTAAEQCFGIDAGDAIGRSIEDFVEAVPGEKISRGDAATASGRKDPSGSSAPEEAMGLRADGSRFPVEYTTSSLTLADGRFETMILRDITERRRAEEQLRSQKESLESAMEELKTLNEELHDRTSELELAMGARSRFYASMSHELRTPINAILGYSSLLLDNIYGPLNEKQITSITRTHVAGSHLLELVNDILDLSKIEAGKLELQFEPVQLPSLIEDLFITVMPFAEKHGVELTLDTTEEPWESITDPRRVRQIGLNLFSNAIKFGAGKPVRVVCSRAQDGGLILEVSDQGSGIAEEDLERIFDEFVQLEQSVSDPGTGLGLAISRRLAKLLGGSLTVESAVGEGSIFQLIVPRSTLTGSGIHEENNPALVGSHPDKVA
ncbi:response regulator [soil metagenome]